MNKQKRISLFHSYNMRYQMKNRKGFFLNIITIAVGIAIFLAIQSIVVMNENEMKTTAYAKVGGDVGIVLDNGIISESLFQKLERFDEQQQISYTTSYWMQSMISAQKRNSMCTIRYVNPEKYPFYKMKSDRCDYSVLSDKENLIMSENLASSLDVALGEKIVLQGIESSIKSTYTVAAIVPEDGEDSLDMNIYGYVFLAEDNLLEVFGERTDERASKIYIKCEKDLQKEIAGEIPSGQIQDVASELKSIESQVEQSSASYSAMGMLAIMISFIGIISSMILMILRRQKDICIFKIFGATKWNIAVLFLKEMLALTLIGVAGGLLLGILCSYGVCYPIYGYFCNVLGITGFCITMGKVLGLGVTCGAIAGMLPVILTLQFKPVFILRDQNVTGSNLKKKPLFFCIGLLVLLFGGLFSLVEKSPIGFILLLLGVFAVLLLFLFALFLIRVVTRIGCLGGRVREGKIALKSVRKDRGKFSLVVLVQSFCIAIVGLVLLMYNSILPSLEVQVKNSLGYDALFRVSAERESQVNEALKKSGADSFYESTIADFSLQAINHQEVEVLDQYDYSMDCMHGDLSYINDSVIEGDKMKAGGGKAETVVDEEFFRQYGMKLGDTLTLQIGDSECDFTVIGVRRSDKIKTGQLYTDYNAVKEYINTKVLRYYIVCDKVEPFIDHLNQTFDDIVVLNIKDISSPYAAALNKEMLILKLISLLCIGSAFLLIFNILTITYLGKQKEFLLFGLHGANSKTKRKIIAVQGFALGAACAFLAFFISVLGAMVLEAMIGISINYDGVTIMEVFGLSILCAEASTLIISNSLVRYSEYAILRSE